jgi:AraC family transcriptional regulator of adaptative response/methylated-DNA-[protein]-cysteine methyltransferase
MNEDLEYRTKRMQLLCEQVKWVIQNQQLGIGLDELADRMQLGNWEAQHLFQEYLNKDPLRFIRDAFSPSLTQVEEIGQISIFDGFGLERPIRRNVPVEIQFIDSAEEIHYSRFDYFLGELFVASTDAGICQLTFEDAEDGLARLKKTYPNALLIEEKVSLHESVNEVLMNYFSGKKRNMPVIPITVKGTDLQLDVWNKLTELKSGERTSHAEIAAALDNTTPTRKIASAINSNPVALLIPCHRAIPQNGKLGRFKWETWRKQVLLAIEK